MTIGIYMITNLINNKKYIGKSMFLENRTKSHFYPSVHKKYPKHLMYKEMLEYGTDNFKIDILEKFDNKNISLDILNEKERYYIELYKSYIFGYNSGYGGEACAGVGDRNPNSKLTNDIVKNIRFMYRNCILISEAYLLYKEIVSINTFNDVWRGRTWKHIDYDITYTFENKWFHKHKRRYGEDDKHTIQRRQGKEKRINDKKNVYEIRKMQSEGINSIDVYELYKDKITYSTFRNIWTNKVYKDIIVTTNCSDEIDTSRNASDE